MTIGTSDGQQYADQFQHALTVAEPPYHPPEWRGNKEYGETFKSVDTMDELSARGSGFRTNVDWQELDMEKGPESGKDWSPAPSINPPSVPDMSGTRGPGKSNRVASSGNDMPFIKGMKPGESGTPADITQTAREHGDFDFKGAYRRSLGIVRPDWTEEDKDKYLESVPQSSLNSNTKIAANDKFVPINPMTPAYNNPGGHEHIAPIENPGRAVPVHRSTKESPESIYSAAIKTPSGEVYMGINHADAYSKIPTGDPIHSSNDAQWSSAQGYVTSKGRFVSRLEAKPMAKANKQIHTDYESKFGLLSEEMDPKNVENIQKLLIEYLGEKSKK